ncbi:MAG: DUF47 domain-containing protein [Thiotrichales bacterium]
MGFIHDLLLPKEVDFNTALAAQCEVTAEMIHQLYEACSVESGLSPANSPALQAIDQLAEKARDLKRQNMRELLDVFITPYDRESIYRMIVQLDWVSLSVHHFRLETEVFYIHSLHDYEPLFASLKSMIQSLHNALEELDLKDINLITDHSDDIRNEYDNVAVNCGRSIAALMNQPDVLHLFRHQLISMQIKEIAKRIHVTANTLEDMTLKII